LSYYDDNLNWLRRDYVKNNRSFLCPSTQNFLSTNAQVNPANGHLELIDLVNFAVSKGYEPGHSYENFSWWRDVVTGVETKKTESRVNTRTKQFTIPQLGLTKGMLPGPSQTWLQLDADSYYATYPGSRNDYPDPGDNHGDQGHNANFADGHAEFVTVKGKRYLILRELSQDENKAQP
jgi:hypothetical protein